MRKLKLFFACLLMAFLGIGQVWAAEQVAYTLTPATGSNNSYTGNCDVAISGITWNVTGNASLTPWRIGGKSLSSVNRTVFSKTAMSDAITKVELKVGAASSITVNSLKLIVASNSDFSTQIDEVSQTFTANSTITFTPTSPTTEWTTGAYYKFVFNVSVSGTSNKFVEFSEAKFYKEVSTETCENPTFSPAAGTFYGSQEITLATTTTGASIYYTLDGTTPSSSNGTLYEEPFTITETTTIKAVAIKDGATDSGVAEATFTAGETVTSYVIDFEKNNLAAYVNWVFDKIAIRTTTIAAHGGTYYAINATSGSATTGTATATITTVDKIATPGALTFWTSKESANTTASSWKAQVSDDGDTWTDARTFDATTGDKGEWTERTADLSAYTDVYVRIAYSGSTAIRAIDDISLSTTPSLLKPTITGVENFVNTTEVTITQAAADAIYYTTNGDVPTTGSTLYSAPFELNATATVKAIAVKGGESSPVAEKEFTKIVSWSVAEANEQLAISTPQNGKYVRGIISQIDGYSSNAITYWISDDGSTTDQLEVYKGKNLNNTNFSSISDLALGDVVVVYGNLKVFEPSSGGSINEFDAGNYLVSKEAPAVAAPVFSPDGGGFMGETDVTITCATEGSAIYYTLDGTTPSKSSSAYNSDAIHLNATTTIKAIAFVGDDASLVITKTFTLSAPMTVAEALAALDSESPINNAAVSGKISTAPTSNPSSGRLTYYISDDGSTTSQLKVYNGYGLNGASFSNPSDLQVGDEVTVFGNLKIYSEEKEFDAGNRLLAFNRPVVAVTGVELNKDATSLEVGETETLVATIAPEKATNKNVSWSSDAEAVATVEDGIVTAVGAGTAIITVTTTDGSFSDACAVTVTPATPKITITATSSGITTSYEDGTFDQVGVTFSYTQWMESTSFIQAKKSTTGSLKNTTAIPGVIKSITIITGGEHEARAVTINGGATAESLSAITAPETSTSMVFDFGETEYYFFELNTPSNACYFDKIVIEYEKAPEISGIAIKTAPTKTTYTALENFDPTGLVITVNYEGGSSKEVTYSNATASAFSFSPALDVALNATHTGNVVVTYGNQTANQAITVNRIATSLQWSAAIFAVNVGTENPSYPMLTTTPEGLIGVTYSSTDEDVALIDENTGEIFLGDEPGTATITASFAKTDVYAAAENATYTLTLNAANTPIFEVDPNSLDFEAVGLNQSKELTFTLSGSNLTADATLNIGGANAAMFSVSSSIAKDNNGDIITDVTVTYTPTVAGSHVATLTISSTGAQDVTVALVGEGKEIRTVAWQVNGAAYAPHQEDEDGKVNGSTEVLNGGKVAQLPTEPTPCEEGIAFVGWTNNTYTENANAPQVLFKTIADAPEVNSNVIYHAVWAQGTPGAESWTETAITDLTESDVVVIVGNNGSNYAMSNDNGTGSAPSATAVTVSGTQLTGEIADNLKWNISEGESGYTIYPNGSTTTWLYCTNTNNGVRVGTNDNKTFVIDKGYLEHVATIRYVGIYNNQDWRCYSLSNNAIADNIKNQTFKFYKLTTTEPNYSAYSTTCTAPHDITKVSENGTMMVKVGTSEVTTAHTGNTVTVTIEANEHYSLTGFAVNETNSETSVTYTVNDGIYSFTMPDADVTITATYTEETKYTITFNGGGAEGGTAPSIESQYANTQNIPLPKNTYVYDDNHIFNGWAVTSSEGPVAVNDNAFTMPAANVTITAKWALKQQCTLVLHVNGSQSEVGIEQGTAYDLTQIEDPNDVNGYTFYGWAESEETNDVETAIATISSFTPSATETTKNLYAVYTREEEGEGVTDVLTASDLTATGTTYTDFSNVSKTSSAIYAGNSSRNNDLNIQLRSKESNSGIVSTTSGGTIKSVMITVASGSNTIDVYGSNTSYASASDLYGDTKGTKIGSTSGTGTISPTEEQVYNYVGIRSYNGAVYLSSVSITWDNSKTYYTTLPAAVHDVTYVLGDDADWQTGVSHPIAKVKNNGTFTITEDVPVHASNKFSGWKVNGEGETVSGTITITGNTSIVAQWTPKANSALTYSDGAETDPATSSAGSILEGTEIELPAVGTEVVGQINFSKAGFDFKGWKYNGKIYKAGSTFTMPAEPVTLVAQWKKVNTEKYSLVTSASQLLNGMKVVIAYNDNDQQNSQQYVAGNIAGSGNSKYLEAYNTDVTFSGQSLTFTNTNVKEWILMQSGNGWVLKNGEEYLGASTTSMTISTSEYVWNIFITPEGIATLEKDGYSIRYNYNNGSPRFKTYGSNSSITTKPQLYAAMTVIDVANISEVGNVDGDTVVVTTNVTIDVDIAPTTMIVPAGVTVTVSDQNKIDANTLIVEKGGKLDIATTGNVKADDNFVISTTLGAISTNPESGDAVNNGGASSEIINAYKIAASGNVFFEIELTQEDEASYGWYAFSVPFMVDAMSGIYYGNTQLVNEQGYAIMSYDGQKRANGDYGWAKYRGILKPGVLYLITVADTDYKTLRFKKHGNDAFLQSLSIPVSQFTVSGRGQAGVDNGWNGIGNPYMLKSYCTTSTYLQFLDHEANAFKQRLASAVNLVLGSAFFIQYGGDAETIDLTIGEQDGAIALAPTREGSAIENTIFEVKLRNSMTNKEEDNLFLTAREDATNTYEIGRDLAKMSMGTAKCAQIMVPAYGTNLCAADFPLVNNQAVYPLTMTTPTAGTYSLSAAAIEGADLYVTYEGAIVWNLSLGDYELDLTRGTTTGYGLLLVAQPNQMPTGVENGELLNGENGVQKILLNGQLYILRDGHLYDAVGKEMK